MRADREILEMFIIELSVTQRDRLTEYATTRQADVYAAANRLTEQTDYAKALKVLVKALVECHVACPNEAGADRVAFLNGLVVDLNSALPNYYANKSTPEVLQFPLNMLLELATHSGLADSARNHLLYYNNRLSVFATQMLVQMATKPSVDQVAIYIRALETLINEWSMSGDREQQINNLFKHRDFQTVIAFVRQTKPDAYQQFYLRLAKNSDRVEALLAAKIYPVVAVERSNDIRIGVGLFLRTTTEDGRLKFFKDVPQLVTAFSIIELAKLFGLPENGQWKLSKNAEAFFADYALTKNLKAMVKYFDDEEKELQAGRGGAASFVERLKNFKSVVAGAARADGAEMVAQAKAAKPADGLLASTLGWVGLWSGGRYNTELAKLSDADQKVLGNSAVQRFMQAKINGWESQQALKQVATAPASSASKT